MFPLLSLILLLTVATPLFAQDFNAFETHRYRYPKANITITITDSNFNEEGSRMVVTRNEKRLFRGNFVRIKGRPKPIALDSNTYAFLFETWSGGAHCCATLFVGIADSAGFALRDTLFLSDGDYRLRDLDSDRIPEIVANIDFFPYLWTSFTGSDYNTLIYAIVRAGIHDATSRYPKIIERSIRQFERRVRELKQKVTSEEIELEFKSKETEIGPSAYLGELKQELACLLLAYRSLGREAEGWKRVKALFPYKGQSKFLTALRKTMAEQIKAYGEPE